MFDSEPQRRGHYSSHMSRSRKGSNKIFVRKAYYKVPAKKSAVRNEPQLPSTKKRGSRRMPPSSSMLENATRLTEVKKNISQWIRSSDTQ